MAIDATDFRILAALRHNPLASHEDLAKGIELTASSVRRRLSGLMDAGVLVRFIGRPLPGAVGLHGIAGAWRQGLAPERLFEIEGTIFAGTNIDGSAMTGAYVPNPDGWVEEMSALLGAEPVRRIPLEQYNGPPLGRLELKVLRAMVQNPRGSATELAELSGLSAKTVRRHRKSLIDHGAIDVGPMIRLGESGAIATHLHISCEVQDHAAILAALGDVAYDSEPGDMLCVFMRCDSLADQERRLAAVRALGYKIELIHEDDWVFNDDAVLGMIDAAISKWNRDAGA